MKPVEQNLQLDMSSKVLIKIHTGNLKIVSICDKDLFGKEIEYNGIKIKIKEPFYGGNEYDVEKDIDKIKEIIMESDVINAVGKNSIELLRKLGILKDVHENFIHVQIYFI